MDHGAEPRGRCRGLHSRGGCSWGITSSCKDREGRGSGHCPAHPDPLQLSLRALRKAEEKLPRFAGCDSGMFWGTCIRSGSKMSTAAGTDPAGRDGVSGFWTPIPR